LTSFILTWGRLNSENSRTHEIQLAPLVNQLQNMNPMSNDEALKWAADADDSLTHHEILTDEKIIRTVTAEDEDYDDDVTPLNSVKISHSEALNTSLQWAAEQHFEPHEIMLFRRMRDRAFELKIGTSAQKKITDFFLESDTNLNIKYFDVIHYVILQV